MDSSNKHIVNYKEHPFFISQIDWVGKGDVFQVVYLLH